MSNHWTAALFFGAALGLAASVGSAATPIVSPPATSTVRPPGPSDKAQIEALEARFAAAFNAKDVAKIMSVYARDGLFVFDVGPPRQHVGWEDYKKDWEGLFAGIPGPVTFKISDLDVTVVGAVTYSHSIQDMHWARAGGAPTELTVRVTDVYRKTAGRWRIVLEHVSVPIDLDTDKGDLLSKP